MTETRLRLALLSLACWLLLTRTATAAPPSPQSPSGFAGPADVLNLHAGPGNPRSSVIDPAGGFAYFGTDTAPGSIVKFRLADFTIVDTLTLRPGEDRLRSAVIDAVAGFAYFGTDTFPATVVKVRLSDFTRVGVLTFAPGEDQAASAVVDPAGGFAYFGTATSPGLVVKVRLADFTRVSALALGPGEDRLQAAVLDAGTGFAYFGTGTDPGIIVKVRLSDFTRVDALELQPDESFLSCAVLDPVAGDAYFGTVPYRSYGFPPPGGLVKVRLSDFTRVDRLTMSSEAESPRTAVIDTAGGHLYVGTHGNTGFLVKVRLADFTQVGGIFSGNVDGAGVLDPGTGYAYFGQPDFNNSGLPASLLRLGLSDLSLSRTLLQGEGPVRSAAIDLAGGFGYFGTPSSIVKVRLSDFTRVGALPTRSSEGTATSAVLDAASGFAYFGTNSDPGLVVKVRLSDFTRVATLALEPGDGSLQAALLDGAAGVAYFVGFSGRLVKVRLSDFTRVGALDLGTLALSIAPEVVGGYAYVGAYGNSVVKVRLSDFTLAATLTLDPDELPIYGSTVDPAAGYAYFSTYAIPGKLIKVRLSDFTRVATLTLPFGESNSMATLMDAAAGYLYVATTDYPGRIVRVRLADFTRVDALSLGNVFPICAVLDGPARLAYFGTGDPSVARVDLSDRIGTTTALTASANPVEIGQAVTFAATVLPASGPGSPTGTVLFTVDGALLGGATPIVGSVASVSTSSLSPGPHTVTAAYVGNATFSPSVGALPTRQVVAHVTTTEVVPSSNPSLVGQLVTFTATVSAVSPGPTPTGRVQLYVDLAPSGNPVGLDPAGKASVGLSSLREGLHTVSMEYAPTGDFAASTGALGGSQVVSLAPPASFYTLVPCRAVDTRLPPDPVGGPALGPAEARRFALADICGVPPTASAVSLNVTVTNATAASYLTVYGTGERPVASTLNFRPGETRANNAITFVSTDGTGSLTVFNGSAGLVDVILDVNGYFR